MVTAKTRNKKYDKVIQSSLDNKVISWFFTLEKIN